jgi:hypothetical protein
MKYAAYEKVFQKEREIRAASHRTARALKGLSQHGRRRLLLRAAQNVFETLPRELQCDVLNEIRDLLASREKEAEITRAVRTAKGLTARGKATLLAKALKNVWSGRNGENGAEDDFMPGDFDILPADSTSDLRAVFPYVPQGVESIVIDGTTYEEAPHGFMPSMCEARRFVFNPQSGVLLLGPEQ